MVEIPAYAPDGREGHLFLTLQKRGCNTNYAVTEVARALGIGRGEIGVAGLKDRDADTIQWISVPASAAGALANFAHPDIRLGDPQPHGQKLRRGHLRGNAFEIVIRDLAVTPDEAMPRAEAKLAAIASAGGLDNVFGVQRFGHAGANIERGLEALLSSRSARGPRRERGRGRGDLIVSAGQSALFNLYLAVRGQRGLGSTVLVGDVLKKTDTGGLFNCEDADADQARLDAGALVITGPMFGSKMRAPGPDTPSAALEREILDRVHIPPEALKALGRRAPGTRRPLKVRVDAAKVRAISSDGEHSAGSGLSAGVCLSFELPAGAYATTLLRELMGGDP